MPMIELKDVSKWYGSFQVLTDCTTSVERGEVIVVCGPSGSGKSTFARRLSEITGIPTVSLDALFWKPGWVASHTEEFRERVIEAVDQPCWIMDGNYPSNGAAELRRQRSDTVICSTFRAPPACSGSSSGLPAATVRFGPKWRRGVRRKSTSNFFATFGPIESGSGRSS